MKTVLGSRKGPYLKRAAILLLVVALIAGIVGCVGGDGNNGNGSYTLIIDFTAGGTVTVDDVPIPGKAILPYDAGTVVSLNATPSAGYRFVNWTGDVDTVANFNTASTSITMNGDYEIIANFASDNTIPLKNPGSFVQMTIEDVASLDPAWSYDTASGAQVGYIYETLLFYDGEEIDQFVPVLATEWELLDDNVTYRFKIREGVKFHEGGDLTPSDVEYSFERAMVQDRYAGPVWMFIQPLIGGDVYGLDDTTFTAIDSRVEADGDWVVFHLVDPSWGLAFLQILCSPWASIVDKEWCIAQGDWDGTEGDIDRVKHPGNAADTVLYDQTNGTGPWRLEEWDPGVQTKLVRNDNYWREPAAFEEVITRIVPEWTTRKEALLAGDADLVYATSPWHSWNCSGFEDIEELEDIADLKVYQDLPQLMVDGFLFNLDISGESEFIGSGVLDGNGIPADFFTDIDVRKGFCYAFDHETFIEDGWLGQAQQVGSPVCEGLPYFNPNASMYSFDLAKAEEHLKAAWEGEVWEKGFKFTLIYVNCRPERETACEILAENLVAINPKFQVSLLPMDCPFNIGLYTRDRLLPMFQIGYIVDYPHPNDFVRPFMARDVVFAGAQGYGYPELDELIEGAFKELDPAVQQDMYYEIQERYYEDAPSIMLCQPLGRCFFTKYVEGFYYNPVIGAYAGLPLYYMSKSES
jgi:peptide/nickel transport system substrate-binding protein